MQRIRSPQPTIALSPLAATLMDFLASVANKRLTARLSPLDATLTKYTGGWSLNLPTLSTRAPTYSLCFQTVAHSLARRKTQLFSFQSIPHSLSENTRGGGRVPLVDWPSFLSARATLLRQSFLLFRLCELCDLGDLCVNSVSFL